MEDIGREEEGLTGAGGTSGGSPLFSDTIMLMQRPLLKQRRRTTAAAELEGRSARGRRRREEARGGKMERPPGPIYKGRKINVGRENRGAEFLDMRRSCRLDCRRLINEDGLYAVLK